MEPIRKLSLCGFGLALSLPGLAQVDGLDAATEAMRRHKALLEQTVAAVEPGSDARRSAGRPAATAATAASRGITQATAGGSRDPFAATAEMLRGEGVASSAADGVAGRMPALRLRGIAQGPGEAGFALIEVEGQGRAPYMLRPGEELTLQGGDGGIRIRLSRILATSVEVETQQGQRLVLR